MLELEELQEGKKVKLGFYPYTYVRTIVMKSLLFRESDYHKMVKMSFSEIAKLLQESHYRKEINSLATEHSGADLLELALNRSLAESFKKLIMISPNELGLLIREYARRKDIEDIKTILRGRFTKADESLIINSITGAGTLSRDFLLSLLKKDSVEEILKSIKMLRPSILKKLLKDLNEKRSLVGVENTLDSFYYSRLIKFAESLPKEGDLMKNFITREVEILNILTLLRLKKANFSKKDIKDFIILSGNKAKDSKINSLIDIDLDNISKALSKTEYKNVVSKSIEEYKKTGSLINLETELYKHLLKQSILLLHQHILSIDVMLSYMFAKDIEVRNLKIIVKGKQLGLSEEFIESQLIY